jgi:dTDP-4-amino-4,6-dideoxygalactose transaminase
VNSRLDPLQAAFLLVNLEYLSKWNLRRKEIAQMYMNLLKTNSRFTFLNPGSVDSVWHHFPILAVDRDILQSKLRDVGIVTEIHYPNLAAIEHAGIVGKSADLFPVAENISSKILSLPISPWHTDEQIHYVCQELNSIAG